MMAEPKVAAIHPMMHISVAVLAYVHAHSGLLLFPPVYSFRKEIGYQMCMKMRVYTNSNHEKQERQMSRE
jgi:hypothetical protein